LSEYQYYEFQAVDRPLTAKEMNELRAFSTRARVDGEGWLSSFISLRADVARGDLRTMYLAWLLCAQHGEVDDDAIEPPIPTGLSQLGAALEGLVEFLRIDPHLVTAAASASGPLVTEEHTPEATRQWIADQPAATKDDLLARLMAGDAAVASGLVQRMRRERGVDAVDEGESKRRTAGELVRAAEHLAAKRRRAQETAAAKAKASRERNAAAARARHLSKLVGREPTLWKQVDDLIATRQPRSYDEAVKLLVDLRELSVRKNGTHFNRRLKALRAEHMRKPSLLARLDKAIRRP